MNKLLRRVVSPAFLFTTALGLSLPSARATIWSAGTYPTRATLGTSGSGATINFIWLGTEPAANNKATTFLGYPSNYCLSTILTPFVSGSTTWTGVTGTTTTGGTPGGTAMGLLLWANRNNGGNPNASKPDGISTAFPRTTPLAWSGTASPNYIKSELVSSGSDWYYCITGSSTLAPVTDNTQWALCTATTSGTIPIHTYKGVEVDPPDCRVEYGSYQTAIASNISQVLWLAGDPAYVLGSGSALPISQWGYLDVSNSYNMRMYCFNDVSNANYGTYPSKITGTSAVFSGTNPVQNFTGTNADAIFNVRALAGSVEYAVPSSTVRSGTAGTDLVYLPINRLADCWQDYNLPMYATGSSGKFTYGQIVRDQGNLLPNDMLKYRAETYTDSLSGLTPADTTKPFFTSTSNGYAVGYVKMIGVSASATVRLLQKDVIDLTVTGSNRTYALTVTGQVAVPASSGTLGNVTCQVCALDGTGNYIGNAFKTFNLAGSPTGDVNKQFSFTQNFAATATTGVLAWPAGTRYLRFNAMTNHYATGSTGVGVDNANMEIDVCSLLVRDVTSGTANPTYWQCIRSGTLTNTAPADGHTFTPFASLRTGTGAANWQPQQFGIELDYEVNDLRPGDSSYDYTGTGAYPNTDQNLVYLFKSMHDTLTAQGYFLTIGASAIDPYNPTNLNLDHNAINNENLSEIYQNVDCLSVGAYSSNFCGADISAVLGADYYRLRYVTSGTILNSGTERPNFSADKIGFQLEMLNKNSGASVPVSDITGSGTTYTITTVGANGALNAGLSVFLNGFVGDAAFLNGKHYRVSDNGNPFKIDAEMRVSGTDANGVIQVSAYPISGAVTPSAWGGGIVGSAGATSGDFTYALNQFIKNPDPKWQVRHWEGIQNGGKREAYQNVAAATTELNVPVTSLSVLGDGTTTVLTTSGTVPDTTITLSGLADTTNIADVSQLNGSTITIVTTGTDLMTGHVNSGTNFILKNFDGRGIFAAGAGLVSGSTFSGTAFKSTTMNINRKLGAIVFGATP